LFWRGGEARSRSRRRGKTIIQKNSSVKTLTKSKKEAAQKRIIWGGGQSERVWKPIEGESGPPLLVNSIKGCQAEGRGGSSKNYGEEWHVTSRTDGEGSTSQIRKKILDVLTRVSKNWGGQGLPLDKGKKEQCTQQRPILQRLGSCQLRLLWLGRQNWG